MTVFAAGCHQEKKSFRRDLHLFFVLCIGTKVCFSSSDLVSLEVWDLKRRRCKWGFRSDGRATFKFLGLLGGRQCICNKLQVESPLFFSLSHSTPFN